jgi:FkbM family methyltransferase
MFENWYNIIKNNINETGVTQIFDKHYSGRGIVLDIGGNVGAFTDYVLQRYPKKKVYLFEPVPKFSSYLKEKYQNTSVTVVTKALGEKSSTVFMSENAINLGVNEIHPNIPGKIPMITLDSYIKENNITDIGFIKMDVEWYEPFVFFGMKSYFSLTPQSKLPIIVFEDSPNHKFPKQREQVEGILNPYYNIVKENLFPHEVICLPKTK